MSGKHKVPKVIAILLVLIMLMPAAVSLVDVVDENQVVFSLLENSEENEERNENSEANKKNEQYQTRMFTLIYSETGFGISTLHVPLGHDLINKTHYLDVLTQPPDCNRPIV